VRQRELEPDLEYQKAFGEHLREMRDRIGFTQVDLSVYSKVSVHQIGIIENGHEAPTLQTIKALAVGLGKHPSELLNFKFSLKLNANFPRKREKRLSTTYLINLLLADNFFSSPRSVKDVVDKCSERSNVKLRSTDTSGALLILVKKKTLKVIKSGNKNLYQNVKTRKS
jgi:transcriptional regulator with XRE-family HTH domain